jgi:hypothetical protein
MHTMDARMVNERMLKACSVDMKSLHDFVLYLEQRQLDENDSTYPLMAKLPKGKGFVEAPPILCCFGLLTYSTYFTCIGCTRPSSAYFP